MATGHLNLKTVDNQIPSQEVSDKLEELNDMRQTLKQWEIKNAQLKNLKEEIEENKMFLQYTEDAINRLKIRQNYLMK